MGWIVGDEGPHAIRCLVADVTRAGARLKLFAATDIPREFTLHFTRTGDASIRCRLRWRGDGEAGAEFVSEPTRPPQLPQEAGVRVATAQAAGAKPKASVRRHA